MKLSSFKNKRESFDHLVEDATFVLMPLPSDLAMMSNAFLINGGKEILSPAQKIRFIEECIVGWSGVTDDEDEEIAFSGKAKAQLIAPEFDGLLFELISASFMHKNKRLETLQEDLENAKKSQTA